MINLIPGKKGTGKTKILVDSIKKAAENATGNVVCIERGMQLTYDLPHNVRLADAEEYGINSFDSFYGFVAGLMAGNYDIQEVFVDGILKIDVIVVQAPDLPLCHSQQMPVFQTADGNRPVRLPVNRTSAELAAT